MRRFISLLILILCLPVHAEWYEAVGQAEIQNGDKDAARTRATQEAIKQALIVAGASVSAVQHTLNGLLTEESIEVQAGGDIHDVELISEVQTDNSIVVTIRADIVTSQRKCYAADYRKSVAIAQFSLVDRQQAVIGHLYDIGSQIPERMENYLASFSNYTHVNTVVDRKTQFTPQLMNDPERLSDLITITAEMTDAQFVLFGTINDISVGNTDSNYLQFWKGDKTDRFFEVELFLYSGINGELIFNKRFHTRSEWDFGMREKVNLRSRRFWESKYGQSILQVTAEAATSIDEHVKCLPSRARVISVNDNKVQFNLGAKNGVKIGDKLSLLHLANFKDSSGRLRSKFNISPFTVEVTQVYQSSALAKSVDDMHLSNIQPNDLVVRQ